jgi:hypothetical protein
MHLIYPEASRGISFARARDPFASCEATHLPRKTHGVGLTAASRRM